MLFDVCPCGPDQRSQFTSQCNAHADSKSWFLQGVFVSWFVQCCFVILDLISQIWKKVVWLMTAFLKKFDLSNLQTRTRRSKPQSLCPNHHQSTKHVFVDTSTNISGTRTRGLKCSLILKTPISHFSPHTQSSYPSFPSVHGAFLFREPFSLSEAESMGREKGATGQDLRPHQKHKTLKPNSSICPNLTWSLNPWMLNPKTYNLKPYNLKSETLSSSCLMQKEFTDRKFQRRVLRCSRFRV